MTVSGAVFCGKFLGNNIVPLSGGRPVWTKKNFQAVSPSGRWVQGGRVEKFNGTFNYSSVGYKIRLLQ